MLKLILITCRKTLLILKSDISALEHSRDLFLVVIMADVAVSVVRLFGLAIQDSENILVNILFRCMIDMNKGGKTKTEKI